MSDFSDDEVQIDEEAIRRQVNRRIFRWGTLAVHGIAWVVGSGLIGVALDKPASTVAIMLWLGLLATHGALLGLLQMREGMLQGAIKHERQRASEQRYEEKLKRDRLYRLSDDGELVEVGEEELPDKSKNNVQS